MRTHNSPTREPVDWLREHRIPIAILNGIAIGVLFAFCCLIGGYVLMQMLAQAAQ